MKNRHAFSFGGESNREFLMDGQPFQIRSAEMHPQRIPREYWKHRVQMAKAMGLNTIAFYVMWNDLEQGEGHFDFTTGSRDVAGFLRICAEVDMWVLFRPGPYVCGEWDFGGIPSRLLKYSDLKIRTHLDSRFMEAQARYLEAIADVAAPFRWSEGGPILMVQIENEYGSYQRKEKAYMQGLLDFWTRRGFGPFYTSDGAGENFLKDVVLPGVAVGLDPGEKDEHWNIAHRMNPEVPVFSSETYPGWLRHWGEGNWKATDKVGVMKWYMEAGKSFNLYMFHGGTNFGLTAGANHGGPGKYEPDITSYDYGAPVNEQGCATEAYHTLRDIMVSFLAKDDPLPGIPAAVPSMNLPEFVPERVVGLWSLLPERHRIGPDRMWFEAWEQNQGIAVYCTVLPAGPEARFTFENIHDYAQVYLDGKRLTTIDRRLGKEKVIGIPSRDRESELEILVEGMGHINFNIAMESDRKGLFGVTRFDDRIIDAWDVSPLPLENVPIAGEGAGCTPERPGALFCAVVTIDGNPADTFLDMSKYAKGLVWVNGHNLGRYWSIGPQTRLFCPATWLKTGRNRIEILDLELIEPRAVRGCAERNEDRGDVETRNANNEW